MKREDAAPDTDAKLKAGIVRMALPLNAVPMLITDAVLNNGMLVREKQS